MTSELKPVQSLRKQELRMEFPATFPALDGFFHAFRTWAEDVRLPFVFGPELLLREALTNAVVHGSDCDPAKAVLCILRWNGRRLLIAVRDCGPGFDWRTAMTRQGDDYACSGRGVDILRLYATRVRFHPPGNSLILLKRFDKETSDE